jgi:hypothetical protein
MPYNYAKNFELLYLSIFIYIFILVNSLFLHTYRLLILYPRMGSRGIQIFLRDAKVLPKLFTYDNNLLVGFWS